jgi:hypothetical protein
MGARWRGVGRGRGLRGHPCVKGPPPPPKNRWATLSSAPCARCLSGSRARSKSEFAPPVTKHLERYHLSDAPWLPSRTAARAGPAPGTAPAGAPSESAGYSG